MRNKEKLMEILLWIIGTVVVLLFLGIAIAIEDDNKWKGPPEAKGEYTFFDDF